MVVIVIITTLYGSALVFDLIPMLKAGKKINLWIYGSMFAAAYIIQMLFLMDVELPSIHGFIYDVFKHLTVDQFM